jgi:hypothetical protein
LLSAAFIACSGDDPVSSQNNAGRSNAGGAAGSGSGAGGSLGGTAGSSGGSVGSGAQGGSSAGSAGAAGAGGSAGANGASGNSGSAGTEGSGGNPSDGGVGSGGTAGTAGGGDAGDAGPPPFDGQGDPWTKPAPRATCRGSDKAETGVQGLGTDVRCNVDVKGQVAAEHFLSLAWYGSCAYVNGATGTTVIDASNSASPRVVTRLTTAGMQSNWESMKVHEGRGLLVGYQSKRRC